MTDSRRRWTALQKRSIASEQDYKCAICDELLPLWWQVDHIIPLSQGGPDTLENLQVLCSNCHASKTAREVLNLLNDENEYHVRAITDHRFKHKRLQFRVKWTGYPRATWEPLEHVAECAALVTYLRRYPHVRRSIERRRRRQHRRRQ